MIPRSSSSSKLTLNPKPRPNSTSQEGRDRTRGADTTKDIWPDFTFTTLFHFLLGLALAYALIAASLHLPQAYRDARIAFSPSPSYLSSSPPSGDGVGNSIGVADDPSHSQTVLTNTKELIPSHSTKILSHLAPRNVLIALHILTSLVSRTLRAFLSLFSFLSPFKLLSLPPILFSPILKPLLYSLKPLLDPLTLSLRILATPLLLPLRIIKEAVQFLYPVWVFVGAAGVVGGVVGWGASMGVGVVLDWAGESLWVGEGERERGDGTEKGKGKEKRNIQVGEAENGKIEMDEGTRTMLKEARASEVNYDGKGESSVAQALRRRGRSSTSIEVKQEEE